MFGKLISTVLGYNVVDKSSTVVAVSRGLVQFGLLQFITDLVRKYITYTVFIHKKTIEFIYILLL